MGSCLTKNSKPYLWPKRLKNYTLWGRTYLYSPYRGIPPPREAKGLCQCYCIWVTCTSSQLTLLLWAGALYWFGRPILSYRLPCGTYFLQDYIFTYRGLFCVLRELSFAIVKELFSLLGINFCDSVSRIEFKLRAIGKWNNMWRCKAQ